VRSGELSGAGRSNVNALSLGFAHAAEVSFLQVNYAPSPLKTI
jgi:hypothetical protein